MCHREFTAEKAENSNEHILKFGKHLWYRVYYETSIS